MGKKILLADDSITIQKVIELTFSDEDFEVVTVGNGRLAMDKLDEVRPDIVLCDIIMPEKDGYEVCEHIKKSSSHGQVPVLLLTGAFEPFDQERAARVGCDGFLAKPFEPQSLISKVKDLLAQAASRPRPVLPAAAQPVAMPSVAAPAAVAGPPLAAVPPPPPPLSVDPMAVTMPAARPIAPAPFLPPEPEPAPEAEPELEAEPFAAAMPELAPVPPPPVAYADEPVAAPAAGSYNQPMELMTEPGTPPAPYAPAPDLPEDFDVEEPVVASQDELMPLMAEEAASLAAPAPAPPAPEPAAFVAPEVEESARTVMFRAGEAPPWSQPTVEVPLETRAQATMAAAAEPPKPVFEPEPAAVEEEAAFEPDFGEPAEAPAPVAAVVPEPAVVAPPPAIVADVPPPPQAPEPVAAPEPEEVSFADLRAPEPAPAPSAPSHAAEVAVPMEQVAQIAQRVVAQISEKVVREVAWEVIPDLAEALIKKEIERLRAELDKA